MSDPSAATSSGEEDRVTRIRCYGWKIAAVMIRREYRSSILSSDNHVSLLLVAVHRSKPQRYPT